MAFGLILTFGRVLSVLSVMHWLASLFLLFAAGCVIVTATEKHTEKTLKPKSPPLFPPATFIPEVRQRGKQTVYIAIPMILILAVTAAYQIGKDRGYGIRDHELVSNTRWYFGVTVLSQESDRSYIVKIPGFDEKYPWDFCHPLKMPSHVIDIKYEQRFGCKVVNGTGFVKPHEENTNGLPNGRHNPTAPEPAAWTGLEARR